MRRGAWPSRQPAKLAPPYVVSPLTRPLVSTAGRETCLGRPSRRRHVQTFPPLGAPNRWRRVGPGPDARRAMRGRRMSHTFEKKVQKRRPPPPRVRAVFSSSQSLLSLPHIVRSRSLSKKGHHSRCGQPLPAFEARSSTMLSPSPPSSVSLCSVTIRV